MASLLDNLTSSFTSNGSFDLEAAFHGISTAAGGVTPRGVTLDQDALS